MENVFFFLIEINYEVDNSYIQFNDELKFKKIFKIKICNSSKNKNFQFVINVNNNIHEK